MSDRLPLLHVVGDSISMHYGPYLETMLAGWLAYSRKAGHADDPESANGGDSSLVVAYLQSLGNDFLSHIDYLMVNCGLHDIKRSIPDAAYQVPLEQYTANLHAIIKIVQASKAKLIWVRTTPVVDAIHNSLSQPFHRHASDVESYNARADEIMRSNDVPIIDLFTFTWNLGADVYCDHVHFKDAIRVQQAAFIAGALSQIAK